MRIVRLFVVLLSTLIITGSSPAFFSNPEKDKLLIEVVTYVLQRGHFSPKDINDSFSKQVFENYIDGIDGQHRFFLQSDINNFKRYETE
jgi:carboxyl-terminal processing protease